MAAEHEWYDERANVVEFLDWLDACGDLTVTTAIAVVEKPWKWTMEYDAMRKGQAEAFARAEAAV